MRGTEIRMVPGGTFHPCPHGLVPCPPSHPLSSVPHSKKIEKFKNLNLSRAYNVCISTIYPSLYALGPWTVGGYDLAAF